MTLNKNFDKEEALKICQEFLSGPWLHTSLEEFKFSVVSGGLSNSIYRCALPENAIGKECHAPSEVLLRIYGPIQDETNKIVTETTTFMLLAERKLGPKLYGIIPNGRLEEFIPSRTIKKEDYRTFYPLIARELAKIHALDVPIRKVPDFWIIHMNKWLNELEKATLQNTEENFDMCKMYREDIDWLEEEMRHSKSPIMYCHNDLQGGNILLRQDSLHKGDPHLVLIDFEFGAYNYRTFDLANQFCEWCFDYNTEEYPFFTFDFKKFPTKEEQTSYILAYLEQLVIEGCLKSEQIETELESILHEIPLFVMAVNFLWSLWSIKMSFITLNFEFSHQEHGKIRKQFYFTIKEQYKTVRTLNGTCDQKPTTD